MSLDEDIGTLVKLWPELPAIVGEQWADLEPELQRLLGALRMASSDERRERLARDLIARVMEVPKLRARFEEAPKAAAEEPGSEIGAGPAALPLENLDPLLVLTEPAPSHRTRRGGVGAAPTVRGGGRAAPAPAVATERLLRRTPHLDVPEALVEAGMSFTVTVYVDAEGFRPGESGSGLVVPDRPETQLNVWLLVTDHFKTDGKSRSLVIRKDVERSGEVTFEVRVADDAASIGGEPRISAVFMHEGRPAGSVQRVVAISGRAADGGEPPVLPDPVFAVDPDAQRPDLTVVIARPLEHPDQHFVCRVSTPLLPQWADGVERPWPLLETAREYVARAMELFTAALADSGQRRARLIAAGRQLFRAAPSNFREAYWDLVEADAPLRTIYITSAEPYFPWELMIPNEEDGRERDLPVGVEYVVGRWVNKQTVSQRQGVPMDDAYVVAPEYRAGRALAHSAGEAELVCSTFGGTQIKPARIHEIDARVNSRCPALIHFVGHGVAKDNGAQLLELDPDEVLSETELEGWSGLRRGVGTKAPFVFLNACDVGRQAPALALGEMGGFAAAFIALGARCVIAPIWSVEDEVAATVARDFYNEVKAHPERPFAEIMRDLRRRAYEGDEPADSYAAYCFFGDPLAARAPAER